MEPVFLKNPIDNSPSNDTQTDLNAPFSFLEWKQRRPSIIEKQALFQYNKYVLDWFAFNKNKTVSQEFLLKQRYFYLLEQLQLFFSDKEKHEWYNSIDLMNEKELLMAIPYFARKLKNIALYYLNLRKELKNTKLKYNTVGTSFGVEQDLYNTIINGFSTLSKELDPSVRASVPELSSITQSLVIQVEELYDDKDYFDVSPSLPVGERFDLFHDVTAKYYQTKGINLSSEEWILNCLSLSANLDFSTFVDVITASIFEKTDEELYKTFASKYLAENKYSITFTQLSSNVELTETPIQQGHNYFYYPKGVTDPTVLFDKKLKTVSLSALQINGSTAGTTIETSDTIFVKNGNDVKGAWLKYQQFTDQQELLEAKLNEYGSTTFIFPYPGYGLSSEEIAWTGSSLVTTPEYEFLPNNIRASINEAYWSQELGESSSEPISINSTTLLENGSIPNTNPNFADRIYTRTNDYLDIESPAFMLSGAWLYKFDRAVFPISTTSENRFLWPFCLIDSEQNYPAHFQKINFAQVCEPVNISDINVENAIGSDSFETSDKVYKFETYSDGIELATECCWLSCESQILGAHKTFAQNGFNALFDSGQAQSFVWIGPNNTPLDDVFSSISHKNECPFVTNVPEVSSLEWQKCTCKQVYYSPFGHPGNFFEDYNGFADFIVKDPSNGFQEFDLDSWRYIDGTKFKGSLHVAWYKTSEQNPTWGSGRWVNNSSALSTTPFLLETGKSYYYKRAKSKTSTDPLPPYAVSYFYGSKQGKWIGARLNSADEWVSTGVESSMILRPGDVIKYERVQETTQYLISSTITEDSENITENRGSIWSTFDYIVSGSPQSTVYISWPTANTSLGGSSAQQPPFSVSEIKELYWWKIQHTTNPSVSALFESPYTLVEKTSTVFIPPSSVSFTTYFEKQFNNRTTVPFNPPILGTYSVTVSAKGNNGIVYHGTNIPLLSVVPLYEVKDLLIKQGTKSNGFLLEQPLYGWDYISNKPVLRGSGAKPYWAELYIGKGIENRFKGAFSWGYSNNFLDGYVPDHAPKLSPIEIEYGQTLIYDRVGPVMTWVQPITFKISDGSSTWCTLSVTTNEFSNLSSLYISKQQSDLNVYPLSEPTDIELTNIQNGLPVEVFYYALNSFTWTLSTEIENKGEIPERVLNISSDAPWSNLNNRFYSTVATVPLLDEIYSDSNVGGYFVPQNLGATLAINKDFNVDLKNKFLSGSFLIENTDIHIGGRGRTRQDQNTLYTWSEQNQWMKEPPTANNLAGAVKRNLTKTLQTFIPYQEGSEEASLGLTTPNSKVSPWGDTLADTWIDEKNKPMSFTGVYNISAWADSQILKNNQLVVDNWTTDIYGNQYSLFKNLSGIPVSKRHKTPGQLWTKTNDEAIKPASESLSSVFDTFNTHTFYADLTGSGILSIDCFFNTLMLETSASVIFCPLEYNYEAAKLTSVYDDCVVIDNISKDKFRLERTWLHTKTKNVIVFCTELSADKFTPVLYNLSLIDNSFTKVFPLGITNQQSVSLGLTGISVSSLDKAAMHFNSMQQTYLLTYKGFDAAGKMFVVDFNVEQMEDMVLKSVDRFLDTSVVSTIINPPEITNAVFFNAYSVVAGSAFTITLSADNSPTDWEITSTHAFSISANNSGQFFGMIPTPGTYYINYKVSNSGGSVIYPLMIQAT